MTRFGLFATFENPHRDFAQAYAEQTSLVQQVERLGFDEVWVTEHHFNVESPCPALHPILAYLAAKTSRVRLGSAATLLPFHDPVRVAEDVATLDILSGGRFDFGVAKGGPFPAQNRHFGVKTGDARGRALESLDLIERLLSEDETTFAGAHYRTEKLTISPKPLQRPVPIYFATSTPDMVRLAAQKGHGFLCGPPFPLKLVAANAALWRESAQPGLAPKLVLMRFLHIGSSRAAAREEAALLLEPFVTRMRASTATMQPEWTQWFDMERVLDDSLIGTPDEVREQTRAIEALLAPRSIVLKPLSPHVEQRRADLAAFAQMVFPAVRAPAPAI